MPFLCVQLLSARRECMVIFIVGGMYLSVSVKDLSRTVATSSSFGTLQFSITSLPLSY